VPTELIRVSLRAILSIATVMSICVMALGQRNLFDSLEHEEDQAVVARLHRELYKLAPPIMSPVDSKPATYGRFKTSHLKCAKLVYSEPFCIASFVP